MRMLHFDSFLHMETIMSGLFALLLTFLCSGYLIKGATGASPGEGVGHHLAARGALGAHDNVETLERLQLVRSKQREKRSPYYWGTTEEFPAATPRYTATYIPIAGTTHYARETTVQQRLATTQRLQHYTAKYVATTRRRNEPAQTTSGSHQRVTQGGPGGSSSTGGFYWNTRPKTTFTSPPIQVLHTNPAPKPLPPFIQSTPLPGVIHFTPATDPQAAEETLTHYMIIGFVSGGVLIIFIVFICVVVLLSRNRRQTSSDVEREMKPLPPPPPTVHEGSLQGKGSNRSKNSRTSVQPQPIYQN